jgi:hypothetical protein
MSGTSLAKPVAASPGVTPEVAPGVVSGVVSGVASGVAAAAGAPPGVDTAGPAGGGPDDEAARVLSRLERIEALDREHAPPGLVLCELRELVREAEAWARVEGDVRARTAVGKLREEAEGMS